MVCSACGFENGPSMRFCGMCGTPLPHRPMTTPGAQSTLSLTRMPVEAGGTAQETSPTAARSHEVTASNRHASAVADASTTRRATPVAEQPPPKELVPNISLDEYLQKFTTSPPAMRKK